MSVSSYEELVAAAERRADVAEALALRARRGA
jgi:hypothetical protein